MYPPLPASVVRPRTDCARTRTPACRDESGQALVEFALLLPVILLVMFAILQFGLSLNAANDQTNIASEVARYAIVNENPGENEAKKVSLQEWGKGQAYTNYTTALNSEGKVCIEFPTHKEEVGQPVEVKVTSVTHWIPFLGSLGQAGSTTVTGTAVMRLEAKPNPAIFKAGCSA
jgi:Flp pilus assembly protein TadG